MKGELKLYPLLDFYEPLLDSEFWSGRTVAAELIGHRQAGSCWSLKVQGVTDRNQADLMVGRELGFQANSYRQETFPRPEEDCPSGIWGGRSKPQTVSWSAQWTRSGWEAPVFAGHSREKGEILIPTVEPILAHDDNLEGDLVIDPPEGLLDVQD